MNKNPNIEELVERYLEGEMSDLEKLNFENQLVNNSVLQEEFQFQKEIIKGIQENRKAELKARLNNIQVPSSSLYQNIGLKVAALITITTMVGFGAYFTFFNNEPEVENTISVTDTDSVQKSTQEETEIPEAPTPLEEESLEVEEIVVEKPDGKEKSKADEEKKNVAKNKVKEDKEIIEKAEITEENQPVAKALPSPNIVRPESVEGIADDNVEHKDDSFEVSNSSLNAINEVMENKVEVETISDNKKDFHYQFYNKKLFLYGDFDKTPYEIIEYTVENNKNKLYFLYYEGKFYELNSDQMKISPLKEINDNELIGELERLRK